MQVSTDVSFEKVTIPTLDRIIAHIQTQPITSGKLGKQFRELTFWQNVRTAKLRAQLNG